MFKNKILCVFFLVSSFHGSLFAQNKDVITLPSIAPLTANSETNVVLPMRPYEPVASAPVVIDTVTAPSPINNLDTKPLSLPLAEKSLDPLFQKESKAPEVSKDVVNTKSFLEQKTFLKENKNEPSLWQGASLVIGFISLLGIIAFVMTRVRKKGLFSSDKNEKVMNIISTLPITPKRQVMILKIKDKEIVIANTEHGINILTELESSSKTNSLGLTPKEKKPLQIPEHEEKKENKTHDFDSHTGENQSVSNEKKSDILMKALKKMEKASLIEKKEDSAQDTPDNAAKFPKYFSNAFESEAKKDVKKKDENDNVENVTNLIREKLRSMKPLN